MMLRAETITLNDLQWLIYVAIYDAKETGRSGLNAIMTVIVTENCPLKLGYVYGIQCV